MTDRTKTICPPIFDLGGIKMQDISVQYYVELSRDMEKANMIIL